MSLVVKCSKCEEPMTLTDKGVARMRAEGDDAEQVPFICNDCIEELDYIVQPKH